MTRQSGVALLALLIVLGLLVAVYVAGFAGNSARSNETDQRTAEALAQAKEALIGYAASYRDSHPGTVFGYLPCPDFHGGNPEGSSEANCGARPLDPLATPIRQDETVIGRFPWRTLGLPPLRDGDGECLWYAVSGNFKNNPKTDLMSWDTNGLIEIMAPDGANFVAGGAGTTPNLAMRAAAVIFAPGAILPGQNRTPPGTSPPETCGGNYTASNYLEPDVSSGIDNAAASMTANESSQFIAALNSDRTAATGDVFNDRLAAISPNEIFAARVQKRSDFLPYLIDPDTGMLSRVANCIAEYGNKNSDPADRRLPWAAPLDFVNKIYGLNSNYNDASGLIFGRLPYIADTSATTTNNKLVQANGVLLDKCTGWADWDEFWLNFKDHVFYAVSPAFAPDSSVASNFDPCSFGECLTVNDNKSFAAVIIFAGAKRGTQSRNNEDGLDTSIDKGIVANYLEGANLAAMLAGNDTSDPNNNWGKFSASFAQGNDTVFCVNKDMTLNPTCSGITTCASNALLLANFRDEYDNNNCRDGKKAKPECKALADNIRSNKSCSCRKGAKKFISDKCLKGFSSKACADAHVELLGC